MSLYEQLSDISPVVRNFYPDAAPLNNLMHNVIQAIFNEYDYTPHQILLANSICSDDINSIEYPDEARQMLGSFEMGGLNGYPFTGLTGMSAFASHVPDDGAVLIFYGPHIGVTTHGKIGRVTRSGQHMETNCCGAAAAALSRINDPSRIDPLDEQIITLENILKNNKERISEAVIPDMQAAEVFFEAIDERIRLLISKTEFSGNHIFLLGGIIINCREKFGSFFSLRKNEILTSHNKKFCGKLNL